MLEIVDLYVCVYCKARPAETALDTKIDPDYRPGSVLHARLQEKIAEKNLPVRLHIAECFSVCKKACTVCVSAPNKWSYVIGDLDADQAVDDLLTYAERYANSQDGRVPVAERPPAVVGKFIARVPAQKII